MEKEFIEGMLKDLLYEADLETLSPNQSELIRSFSAQFKERGFLSDKQQNVLRKIYTDKIG